MKKINNIIAVAMMVLGLNSSVYAIKEKHYFQEELNEIKSYAETTIPEALKADVCIAKFEAQEVFSRLDTLLNKIYKYLKNTRDSKTFEGIKKKQQQWIKDKEEAAKKAAQAAEDRNLMVYDKYKVYNDYTAKKCEELIEFVIDDPDAPEESKTFEEHAYDDFSKEIAGIEHFAKIIYDDETLAQYEINLTSSAISDKWSALMEKMVTYLKSHLDEKSAANLEKSQKAYKEQAKMLADKEGQNWGGGSGYQMAVSGSYSDSWHNRCKALLEDIKANKFEYDDSVLENPARLEFETKYRFIEVEEEDRDNRFGNSDNTPESNEAYLKETINLFAKWDKLLNDVYKHLKESLNPNEFDSLKQIQRDWIKEKEEAAAQARLSSRGGNADLCAVVSDIKLTKERIKALIELVK